MKAKAGSTAGGGRSKEAAQQSPFEFCAVCNLNHNQGTKHKYFPKHAKSLSSLLSRFQRKVSDIRFFLRNPSFLRPEHGELNRLWCIFCDRDITEFNSTFACANIISHLSGREHLKNSREYLHRHGGGKEKLELFQVSEEDLTRWEKKCEALEIAARSSHGAAALPVQAPLAKDIHHQITTNNTDFIENNTSKCLENRASHGVLPLQSHTNEGLLQSLEEIRGMDSGSTPVDDTGHVGIQEQCRCPANGAYLRSMLLDGKVFGRSSNGQQEWKTMVREEFANGYREMSCSGVLPPWLEMDARGTRSVANQGCTNNASSSTQAQKALKLNPNRVGAAWAEKRRAEMEMEKRGEIVVQYDPDWLPNFGGVWQAGTRKESKREFKMKVGKKLIHEEPETKLNLQPYVSKRMCLDSDGKSTTN